MAEEKIHEIDLKATKNETIIDTFIKTTLTNQDRDITELKTMITDLSKKVDQNIVLFTKEVHEVNLKLVEHDKAGSKDAKWLSGVSTSGLVTAIGMIIAVINGWI